MKIDGITNLIAMFFILVDLLFRIVMIGMHESREFFVTISLQNPYRAYLRLLTLLRRFQAKVMQAGI
jgi:hypothetical protein